MWLSTTVRGGALGGRGRAAWRGRGVGESEGHTMAKKTLWCTRTMVPDPQASSDQPSGFAGAGTAAGRAGRARPLTTRAMHVLALPIEMLRTVRG